MFDTEMQNKWVSCHLIINTYSFLHNCTFLLYQIYLYNILMGKICLIRDLMFNQKKALSNPLLFNNLLKIKQYHIFKCEITGKKLSSTIICLLTSFFTFTKKNNLLKLLFLHLLTVISLILPRTSKSRLTCKISLRRYKILFLFYQFLIHFSSLL